jgi:hypothetical protein
MELKLGNRTIHIRKWKGKDKKNFINSLKSENVDKLKLMNTLVYDCIEEDVILSNEEFKYVLTRIRAESLGEEFDIEFYCDGCGSLFTKKLLLKDIITYSFDELKEINVHGISIKLGPIKNKEVYLDLMDKDENYDFLLRIESFNGDDSFTLKELEEKIDDLDLDVLTDIMEIYHKSRFTVKDVNTITCNCGKSHRYIFDEIPGFLPEDWFKLE